MIPRWKLKREIRRIKMQILSKRDLVLARPRRVIYDLLRPLLCRVTHGQIPPGPHMAVFLLYQPKGLSASARIAIDAVLDSGAVPVFVSNLRLSAADRAYLASKSWRVVERPNVGYDFGGYREGITQIFDTGLDPDRLWILNDSTWFPVCDVDQPLHQLVDDRADVSGAMVHMDGRDHDKDYAESYFLAFPKSTIRHPAFVKFWRSYPLYNDKIVVIRCGELGFSQAMRATGLRVESRMNNTAFLARLDEQSTEFLQKTLYYGGLTDREMTAERAALLQTADGSDQWRAAALDHVRKTLHRTGFRYQYCYAAVWLMQFPLVKKGPDPRSIIGRARYLAAVQAGDLPPPPPPILQEVTAAVAYDVVQNYEWQRPGASLG
jgi:Rhamnan synthesis protein F